MDERRKEYTFFWYIENYSCCWHLHGKKLVSPSFIVNQLEGTAWSLELYPRGMESEYIPEDRMSLLLRRSYQDDGPGKFWVNFEIGIIAADGSDIFCMNLSNSFYRGGHQGLLGFLYLEKLLLEERAAYLPQDILTIRLKIRRGKGRFQNIGQSSARSYIKIEKNSFLHAVENFSTLQANVKQTKIIQSHSKNDYSFSSNLIFTEGSMMVDIALPDSILNSDQMFCNCDVFLLDRSGNIIECGGIDNRYEAARKSIYTIVLSLTREEILKRKSEYLRNDKLSLICECTFSPGISFGAMEETLNEIPQVVIKKKSDCNAVKNKAEKPAEKLSSIPNVSEDIDVTRNNTDKAAENLSTCSSVSEDIKALYVNQCLTDVEIKTGRNSFRAHKIILCARSPVFKTMLTSDMKEKNTDRICVDDLENDIVQQLLLFLYSDNVENLQWENATQLYYAADKYQIGKLKKVCTTFLVGNLTTSNAVELLLLADTHNDNVLKQSVEDFILENEEEIFSSKEWDMVVEKNPLLVINTMKLKYKRKV